MAQAAATAPTTLTRNQRLHAACAHNRDTGLITLRAGATVWFVATVLGQWAFLAYTLIAYGLPALTGDLVAWNQHIDSAHVPGEHAGNAMVAVHLTTAALVLGVGPFQLIPAARDRWPRAHRWAGVAYLLGSAVAVLAGLYMLFDRDIGAFSLRAGFVSQAVLMAFFGWLTYRTASRRAFAEHHRWALRFYMVTNIALFYRVIFVLWYMATGGIGVDTETGEGVFLDAMAVGQCLPLAILEAYLRVKERGSRRLRIVLAWGLGVAALATIAATLALSAGMWFGPMM